MEKGVKYKRTVCVLHYIFSTDRVLNYSHSITMGKVYAIRKIIKEDNEIRYKIRIDHGNKMQAIPAYCFSDEPLMSDGTVDKKKMPKMRVKCTSTSVTVFPPGGGHYERPLSDIITVGNVYEVISRPHSDNYRILHDHGSQESNFPSYLFEPTLEPVTENLDREAEIAEENRRARERYEEQKRVEEQQSIQDNMDLYYCPEKYYAREAARRRRVSVCQRIFVGGLPYG